MGGGKETTLRDQVRMPCLTAGACARARQVCPPLAAALSTLWPQLPNILTSQVEALSWTYSTPSKPLVAPSIAG